MNIQDLLDILDGGGLVITDQELLEETLKENGLSLETDVSEIKEKINW